MRTAETSKKYPKKKIKILSDSLTDMLFVWDAQPHKMWHQGLAGRLNDAGALTECRAYGISGQATSQFIGRADILLQREMAALGIVYGGTNDITMAETGTCPAVHAAQNGIYLKKTGQTARNSWQGQIITITSGTGAGQSRVIIDFWYDTNTTDPNLSRGVATVLNDWVTKPDATSVYSIAISTQANIQANLQGCIKIFKYGVAGAGLGRGTSFYTQSMLPANGKMGQRYLIYKDDSTTGGCANKSDNNQHDRITDDFSANPQQTVWEYRNSQSGEKGWARVAKTGTPAWATEKVMLVGHQYLNFATAGYDNFNVTTNTGTKFAEYIPLRAAQIAAATAENVPYCDLYSFMSVLINGGVWEGETFAKETDQGSCSMFIAEEDRHYNQYGQEFEERGIFLKIMKQPGWLEALS